MIECIEEGVSVKDYRGKSWREVYRGMSWRDRL